MNKRRRSYNADIKTVAIIPAGGAGTRMGTGQPKQFVDLDGRPLLSMTLEKFQRAQGIDCILVVVPRSDVSYCQTEIVERYNLKKVEKVVAGGPRRQDSVRIGIEASGGAYGMVVIHDGVRPLVNPELIDRVIAAAKEDRAVITGLPAKETVKGIDTKGCVIETYDRQKVWLVQTPQVFRYEDILMAHQRAIREGWEEATDDALLIEKVGIPVKIIEGSEDNIKVTTVHDLELARFLMGRDRARRIHTDEST